MSWTYFFIVCILFQIFLIGPVFTFVLNLLFKKYFRVNLNKSIFFLPFFCFIGKDLYFRLDVNKKIDDVELKIGYCFYFLNPITILFLKIRIFFTILYNLEMKYINKIPSIEKIKYLPPLNLFILRNSFVINANLDIEDRTAFPIYKSFIKELNLYNTKFDPSIPFAVLFNTKKGHCKIGSGHVRVNKKGDLGSISLQGVTWGELISLQDLPIGFLNNQLNLKAEYVNFRKETHVTGFLNFEKIDPSETVASVKKNLHFSYRLNWLEYKLPFDLGLKKAISQILLGLNYSGMFSFTFKMIISGVNNIFLKMKTPKDN